MISSFSDARYFIRGCRSVAAFAPQTVNFTSDHDFLDGGDGVTVLSWRVSLQLPVNSSPGNALEQKITRIEVCYIHPDEGNGIA
ncbi:MAG: hypothetical protein AAFW83_14540, partial [Pseudomonadota bacterium]